MIHAPVIIGEALVGHLLNIGVALSPLDLGRVDLHRPAPCGRRAAAAGTGMSSMDCLSHRAPRIIKLTKNNLVWALSVLVTPCCHCWSWNAAISANDQTHIGDGNTASIEHIQVTTPASQAFRDLCALQL